MVTKKSNGETRSLVISDFRNLGISTPGKSKDEKAFLKINRSLKKDELGGLVIILGGNNSGKTNILDAVAKYPKQNFTKDDRTDFKTTPKSPQLKMDIAGGKYGRCVPPKILNGYGRCRVVGSVADVLLYILRQKESFDLFKEWAGKENIEVKDAKEYLNNLEWQIKVLCKRSYEGGFCKGYAYAIANRTDLVGVDLDNIVKDMETGDLTSFTDNLDVQVNGKPIEDTVIIDYAKVPEAKDVGKVPRYELLETIKEREANESGLKKIPKKVIDAINFRKKYDPTDEVILIDLPGVVNPVEVVDDDFSKRYGYNLSNRVFRYTQSRITNADFVSSAKKPNQFITQVFTLLGYKNKSIINKYYDKYEIRDKIEKDLNAKLSETSKQLNKLLNSRELKYELHIRLEQERIIFSISYGDNIKLNLDHQSEGFRWLFGFFINFLMSKKFVAGDMVVIDEFGGLLNFGTVKELVGALRDYSKQNGITFIIATQNPMAVDIHHLDEVRMVVPKPDGGSEIQNDFTQFGDGACVDVLNPIIASMTIGRNYLKTEESATVFVENYFDYFILNGFSKMFGFNIDFIPVNRITDTTSSDDLIRALRSIDRNAGLFLDEKAHDKKFIDELKNDKRAKTYTVSEYFEGRRSLIELFSDEDASRLSIADLQFDDAAVLSYRIPLDSAMSEDTKKNFHDLLEPMSME